MCAACHIDRASSLCLLTEETRTTSPLFPANVYMLHLTEADKSQLRAQLPACVLYPE